jgi:hypothetical protein
VSFLVVAGVVTDHSEKGGSSLGAGIVGAERLNLVVAGVVTDHSEKGGNFLGAGIVGVERLNLVVAGVVTDHSEKEGSSLGAGIVGAERLNLIQFLHNTACIRGGIVEMQYVFFKLQWLSSWWHGNWGEEYSTSRLSIQENFDKRDNL